MSYLIANLFGLVGLVGALYLTGWIVDHLLMEGRGLESLSGVGRFGLGAAVWMGLLFALAVLGLLNAAMLGLMLLLTLVGVWWYRRTTDVGLLPISNASTVATNDWSARSLGVGLVGLLGILWLQALSPQISWDSAAYHLTVPRLYLEHGGFRRIPFNVYSNWPLNTQMLFAMALMVGDHVLAKLVHFIFGVATLLAIYRVVASKNASWVGWIGAALFVANPVVLDEMRAAYVDLAFAFFFFLAFMLVHFALESEEGSGRKLLVAGVFAGVAAGIKPTGLMGVACLVALYLVVSLRRHWPGSEVVGGVVRLVVPVGLLLAPWIIKSWVLTGNPIYPFFYSVLGGPEWSAELSQQLREWQQGMGMGRSWTDFLLLPFRVVIQGGPGYDHFDGSILPLWAILVPVALVVGRRQSLILRSLGVAGLYFVFWALSSQQMRFLIPILPLLAVAGALGIFEVSRQVPPKIQPVIRWGSCLAMLVWLLVIIGGQATSAGAMLRQYIEQGREVRALTVHPVYRFIDEQLPQDAKLMFLNTNHGFYCTREFVADSFFEASQINALLRASEGVEGIDQALRELGITHLLIENRDRYVPWPKTLFEYLNDPTRARQLMRTEDAIYDVVEIVRAVPRATS